MLSYSWGMTSNKRGCEAQTPSLVPPIEASPLLVYSHFGRRSGKVRRPCHNLGQRTRGSGGDHFKPQLFQDALELFEQIFGHGHRRRAEAVAQEIAGCGVLEQAVGEF